MKLRNLSRSILYGSFLALGLFIGFLYWLDSNHLIIKSFNIGPVQINSLELRLSTGFNSKKLSIKLGDVDISLSDVSVNWNRWRFLLGNFDSVICKKVTFKIPRFDQTTHSVTKNSPNSLINQVLTRRLNIDLIKVDRLESINSELEADSITANLSGSQLQLQGSNFIMRTLDQKLLSAPKLIGKFHFPTNRLVLETFELNNDNFGHLKIKDLDIPINLRPGATIVCREIYSDKLNQTLQNFNIEWKIDDSYQTSFKLYNKGDLVVSKLVLNKDLEPTELKFDAKKFEINFDLLWLNKFFNGRLSQLISEIPNPLTTGEIQPQLITNKTIQLEMDGYVNLNQTIHHRNKVNLISSVKWTTADSKNVSIEAQIKHDPANVEYQITPLQILIDTNGSNIWQTTLSTNFTYANETLTLTQLRLNRAQWKEKFLVKNIRSNRLILDDNSHISGSLSCQSIKMHTILSAGSTSVSLNGKPSDLDAKIKLQNLSILDFGTAEKTQAVARLEGDYLRLKFQIQNYSKMNSFSSTASGSMTWSPDGSEGFIKINTGSISLADYLNFDSSDDSNEETSPTPYQWTISGKTMIDDDQLEGSTNFKLVFDHRFEGPSGTAELESGIFKLAGNKFTLIEPAKIKLFPKAKAVYQDELIQTLQSQNHSQTLTEQLQAMWDASNPNEERYFEHGIWIHLIAGVKFRGEDIEIKISGRYPQLRFNLTSLSGKSDEELFSSFMGSLQSQLGDQTSKLSRTEDQNKQGANLIVNTMIDSFFGSVFNNLGTQFHTQIGNSTQSSVSIQQPLGDNLSIGLTQGKEGNIDTKSKNFELQFKPGSSIKIENIEKNGYQNETQVEIQKRFRF